MKKLKLCVLAHWQDNGDGSNSVRLYNDEQGLLSAIEGDVERLESIKNQDDPYEYGTLTNVTLNLVQDEQTGEVSLDKYAFMSSD